MAEPVSHTLAYLRRLDEKFDSLDEKFGRLDEKFDRLHSEVGERFDRVEGRLGAIEDELLVLNGIACAWKNARSRRRG
jgi:hypothetical protein